MFQIEKMLLKFNNPGEPIKPVGIVIHETANPGDSASIEFAYFNKQDRGASAHAFVDDNKILQCIEWNNKAWHAGSTANSKYVGIEMCHALTKDKFDIIFSQTVQLCAYLFANVLNIENVNGDNLMSHQDVSRKWKETDHEDPIAYFKEFGVTMDLFRNEVQKALDKLNLENNLVTVTNTTDSTKSQNPVKPNVAAWQNLRFGSKGAAVLELQTFLKNGKYYSGNIDGSFGNMTTKAIKAFQTANGLVADGIIGSKSIAAMLKYVK